MFRTAASQLIRRTTTTKTRFINGQVPLLSQRTEFFHVSSKTEDEAKDAAAVEPPKKEPLIKWDPLYAVPLGIGLAVPAVQLEWYVFNEETQLLACFVMFMSLVYKNFGDTIKEMLEADGKRIIEEHNKIEDEILAKLKEKHHDLLLQDRIVQDAEDIYKLKVETYDKLNAAGKVKPQHDFKAQIDRVLGLIQVEEKNSIEKQKVALMSEATDAVRKELLKNKKLQQQCLDNAIAKLKGAPAGKDPVKETYLQFFKWKSTEAKKVDEAAELAANREALVAKVNAIAGSEGFYFRLQPDGTAKLVA